MVAKCRKRDVIMGKLSKAKSLTQAEQYCIDGMLSNGMSPSKIASTLGRDIELINEYVNNPEQESGPMTINKTLSGNKGVSIMTEAGSQRVDASRNRHYEGAKEKPVHRIHE